jgi:hypothetical protein
VSEDLKPVTGLRHCIPATVIALLLSGPAAIAQVYRCTDAGGAVQYRDTPCDSRTHSLRKLDPPATGSSVPAARLQKTQRLLDALRAERQQKQRRAGEEKAAQAQRRRRCHRARDTLRSLEQAGGVYDLDASGRRVYLSDEGRDRALDAARAEVRQWCEGK